MTGISRVTGSIGELPHDGGPVEVGHQDVEDDDVRPTVGGEAQPLGPRRGLEDGVRIRQLELCQSPRVGVIVDQQYYRFGRAFHDSLVSALLETGGYQTMPCPSLLGMNHPDYLP